MATRPSNFAGTDSKGAPYPFGAAGLRASIPGGKQTSGWLEAEIPPANYQNELSTDASQWMAYLDRVGITPWIASGRSYLVEDLVRVDPAGGTRYRIYRCNTAHTSSAAFTTDVANWEEVSGEAVGIAGASIGGSYNIGDVALREVKVGVVLPTRYKIYRSVLNQTLVADANFDDDAKWNEIAPEATGIMEWNIGSYNRQYAVGDLVLFDPGGGRRIYRCKLDGESAVSGNPPARPAAWDEVSAKVTTIAQLTGDVSVAGTPTAFDVLLWIVGTSKWTRTDSRVVGMYGDDARRNALVNPTFEIGNRDGNALETTLNGETIRAVGWYVLVNGANLQTKFLTSSGGLRLAVENTPMVQHAICQFLDDPTVFSGKFVSAAVNVFQDDGAAGPREYIIALLSAPAAESNPTPIADRDFVLTWNTSGLPTLKAGWAYLASKVISDPGIGAHEFELNAQNFADFTATTLPKNVVFAIMYINRGGSSPQLTLPKYRDVRLNEGTLLLDQPGRLKVARDNAPGGIATNRKGRTGHMAAEYDAVLGTAGAGSANFPVGPAPYSRDVLLNRSFIPLVGTDAFSITQTLTDFSIAGSERLRFRVTAVLLQVENTFTEGDITFHLPNSIVRTALGSTVTSGAVRGTVVVPVYGYTSLGQALLRMIKTAPGAANAFVVGFFVD